MPSSRPSRFVLAGLGALLLAAPPALAAAPTQESQIPVYPGARPVPPEAGEGNMLEGRADSRSESHRELEVTASMDAVLSWYRARLKPTPGATSGNPEELAPGTVSPVELSEYTYSLGDDDDGVGHVYVTGEQKRALLARCGVPRRGAEFLHEAQFSWSARLADGHPANFYVNVIDESVQDGWKGCAGRVRIAIGAAVSKTEDEQEQEREQAQEQRFEQARREVGTRAPTEKELGVPLYPGARYDARTSAGMSMSGQRAFVFVSDDAPEKVLRFYESKLGKKATGDSDVGYMLALEGKGLVPEEGLTVQPNMLGGGGKTLITVMRQKPQHAEQE